MDPLNRFPTMMQDYFMRRLRTTEMVGDARKFGLKTKEEALEYQYEVRQALDTVFGPRPKPVPFNERITGVVDRPKYTIEKIIYDTRENFPVTANLYIPKKLSGPAPCVLGVCGHSFDGKACNPYQAFCQGLATKGYVVMIFDPIGQGERLVFPDGKCGSRYGGTVGDHIQCANSQALLGEWFGNWRVWDGVRSLDYLLSRPEVDPTQVGLTGNSGGGTMTTMLLAAESRFTMGAPGCYITTWRRNLENELPADSEQDPPGALGFGLDMDDLLLMHAPKPLILLTQEHDMFDIRGSEEVYARLKHIYTLMGKPENIALHTGELNHGYQLDMREAMYGFFNKVTGIKASNKEPKREPEPEAELFATKTGRVWELNAASVPEFTAKKARELAAKRKPLEGEALKKALGKLLGLPAKLEETPDYRVLLYSARDREYPKAAASYAVQTEPGIEVMLTAQADCSHVCRIPAPERGKKVATIYLPDLSSDQDLREEQLAKDLVAETNRFFAVDVRGSGESRPSSCGGNHLTPYGSDYFYSYFYMMYGESYVGKRVFDVLRVMQLLTDRGYEKFSLAGRGRGSLIALFAAVLDERVAKVTLKNAPLSYTQMAEDEDYQWPLSGMVWGILQKLDLPDCYKALGKKLTMIEPVNALGEVVKGK
jgi:cephalosporin-C deacetylase-like acetyl esterase